MKTFYVKFIMVFAVIIGMATNVSAAGEYTVLEDAQNALEEKLEIASKLMGEFMDSDVKKDLSVALIEATAVWDSNLVNDINEINSVMPALLDAIDKAQSSVEEYRELAAMIDQFEHDELAKIDELIDNLEDLLGDRIEDDVLLDAIDEAITQWESQLKATLYAVREAGGNPTMLEAFENGDDMRTILAAEGFDIPELMDVVNAIINGSTGIVSAITGAMDDSAEYGLNGSKVSSNYKGLVIKRGKKIIRK